MENAYHFTWVSRSFPSCCSLQDTCLRNVLTPTPSQHAPGGGSGQHCANNDSLLCSIRGSFSLPFYNLTMPSVQIASVGARGAGLGVWRTVAWAAVTLWLALELMLTMGRLYGSLTCWLEELWLSGRVWECESVGGQFHVQQAVSIYSRQA